MTKLLTIAISAGLALNLSLPVVAHSGGMTMERLIFVTEKRSGHSGAECGNGNSGRPEMPPGQTQK